MYRASVLKTQICVTRPQCVKVQWKIMTFNVSFQDSVKWTATATRDRRVWGGSA